MKCGLAASATGAASSRMMRVRENTRSFTLDILSNESAVDALVGMDGVGCRCLSSREYRRPRSCFASACTVEIYHRIWRKTLTISMRFY